MNDSLVSWLNAALLAGMVVCIAVRFAVVRCRGLIKRRGLERLHPVELAFVTGRHNHAVLVACLALVERGSIVPYGPVPAAGALSSEWEHETFGIVTGWAVNTGQADPTAKHEPGSDHQAHPLELAVLKVLEESDGNTDLRRLWWKVKLSHAMGSIAERLASLGFVADRMTKRCLYGGGALLITMLGLALVADVSGIRISGGSILWTFSAVFIGTIVAAQCLRVPSLMPAARRLIYRAKAPYRALFWGAERERAIALAKLARDPAAVAAYGPSFVWRRDPVLAASLGFSPAPRQRKRSAAKAGVAAALAGLVLESAT